VTDIYSIFVYRQVLLPFSAAKVPKFADTGKKLKINYGKTRDISRKISTFAAETNKRMMIFRL